MKQIRFKIEFRDRILSGEKTLTIRDEQKVEVGEEFEIVFVDGEAVIDGNNKILAKCTEIRKVDALAVVDRLKNIEKTSTERLIESLVEQPMVILSVIDNSLDFYVCESEKFGFTTKEEAYEYYKENNLLENSYLHEFELSKEE
ncbi:MAG: hypothetical protein LBH40_04035 [Alphaproteobacteria bacterium]|jgi:uncharacterized protein YqfB (UPF0267 family)|nr:hypothetical protein [Alphaproteobacteria bacterium]